MLLVVLIMELVLFSILLSMMIPIVKIWIEDIRFHNEMEKIQKNLQKGIDK